MLASIISSINLNPIRFKFMKYDQVAMQYADESEQVLKG